ncbi:hypothetical protein [Labrys neptuniae]
MAPGIIRLAVLAAFLAAPALAHAGAGQVPAKVGECVTTRIKEVGTRLENVPDSGSAVVYENGIFGISYEEVQQLRRSKAGDPIKLCLVSVPQDCPPGDDRGKEYKATNLRTKASWTLPNAEHMCGGA